MVIVENFLSIDFRLLVVVGFFTVFLIILFIVFISFFCVIRFIFVVRVSI